VNAVSLRCLDEQFRALHRAGEAEVRGRLAHARDRGLHRSNPGAFGNQECCGCGFGLLALWTDRTTRMKAVNADVVSLQGHRSLGLEAQARQGTGSRTSRGQLAAFPWAPSCAKLLP